MSERSNCVGTTAKPGTPRAKGLSSLPAQYVGLANEKTGALRLDGVLQHFRLRRGRGQGGGVLLRLPEPLGAQGAG